MIKKHWHKTHLLHPLLFSLFPIFSFIKTNITEVMLQDTLRTIFFCLGLAIGTLMLLRLLTRDWGASLILTSFYLILFFSYGHVYELISNFRIANLLIGRHRYLITAWFLISVLFYRWTLKNPEMHNLINNFFLVTGLALMIYPLYSIVTIMIDRSHSKTTMQTAYETRLHWIGEETGQPRPDIYYLVLDGYTRDDILTRIFKYNNSQFLDNLSDRGFCIVDGSYSNYSTTLPSLVSSLNMEYHDEFSDEVGYDSHSFETLRDLLWHNRVRYELTKLGYVMVAFETTYGTTNISDADIYWQVNKSYEALVDLNYFEGLFIETTIMKIMLDGQHRLAESIGVKFLEYEYELHRNRILAILKRIPDVTKLSGDHFVFAHVLAPHPPFVFGPHGERVPQKTPMTLLDGDHFRGSREDYIEGYRDQLSYINMLLEETIDEILSHSDTPPIIILQADHGSGVNLVMNSAQETDLEERFGILNAYYLPDYYSCETYSDLTPVNTFRIVFNSYFNGDFPLLDSKHYFSSTRNPYNYIDVTDDFRP